MNIVVLLGTVGAGIGLAAGLAFNLRLAKALKMPLAATLVNFMVGAMMLFGLWLLGVDGTRPDSFPPLWMIGGGLLGASYVTLSLVGAAKLGVGVSTVAVTFGQVVGALIITALGLFEQKPQLPSLTSILSAVLLLAAVFILTKDRTNHAQKVGQS